MKGLLLILPLLISDVFASPPSCERVKNIAFAYERKIQNQVAPSCSDESFPEIQDFPRKKDILDGLKCSSLGALEERSKVLENQLAMIEGFDLLKKDIALNKEAAGQRDLTLARRSAQDFRSALETARSFELLLNTPGSVSIFTQLKDIPEANRDSVEDIRAAMRTLCANREGRERNNLDACSDNFTPDQNAINSINAILRNEITQESVDQWTQALKIEKVGGGSWSFQDMHRDLIEAIPDLEHGRPTLSRAQLTKIKSIPDFQSVPTLPFLDVLKTAKKGLGTHVALENFKFLAEDLRARSQFESRSKISAVWAEVKNKGIVLEPEQIAFCDQARTDFAKARDCWDALVDKKRTMPSLSDIEKNLITGLEYGLKLSFAYEKDFDEVKACLSPEQLIRSNTGDELTTCSPLNMLSADKAEIQNEILLINALRDRISVGKDRDFKFRNFAIEKLSSMNCAAKEDSIISCENSVATIISPTVFGLTSEVIGMTLVDRNIRNVDLEETCQGQVAKGDETELCQFYDAPPATPNVTDRPAPPTGDSPYIEPVNARDPSREAFTDGLAGIGWGIVNQLQNRPQMYNPYQNMNPYPYNYNPYLQGSRLSPSDQILFNARFYGGYGFYTPTLGAAPYTAFPVISPYMQAGSSNSSSYFSNFGTYK